LVIAIAYGGYLTMQEQMTIGSFVAITLYLRMLMNPLQQIGNVINTMQRARASLERLGKLLEVQPEIREAEHPLSLKPHDTGIELRDLSFAYPQGIRPSLDDIRVDVRPGQTLGIVGKTGSGKTTLVKLLLRVYDPPRGTVFIGGKDILDLSISSLRSQIAYVPQDGFLFSTTIHDNIAFSHRDAGE